VQVLNKKRGEFSDDDADILAALATQAAVSIDNSRLFMSVTQKNIQLLDTKEQLEHRIRDLKLLFDLEHAMGRAVSLEELFMAVLGEAMRACEARMGAVALRDAEELTGALYVIDERARKRSGYPIPGAGPSVGRASGEVFVRATPSTTTRSGADARVVAREDRAGRPPKASTRHRWARSRSTTSEPAVLSMTRTELVELISAPGNMTRFALRVMGAAQLTTIGRLLSNLIHYLKTPLTVISG
jgi:signal transduction histidine kinase